MTTIEILRQAVAGEIENRFENESDDIRTILFMGDKRVFVRAQEDGDEFHLDIDYICEHWSHVPTPQPEVIWEGKHYRFRFVNGHVELKNVTNGGDWEKLVANAHLATDIQFLLEEHASLHSSLKALEQEREQEKKVRASLEKLVKVIESAGLMNLMRGVQLGQMSWYAKAETALAFAKSALSPYPREEKS